MRTSLGAAVAIGAIVGALTLAQPAKANFSLSGGVAGTSPAGSAANDIFVPLYGSTPQPGYYFGDNQAPALGVFTYGAVTLTNASKIDFAFLGKEAGFTNEFQLFLGGVWTTIKSTAGEPNQNGTGTITPAPIGSYTFGAGIVPFRFISNTKVGATNGGTGVGSGFGKNQGIFVTFLDTAGKPSSATSGPVVDVFYDDGGAGQDDNHDDMGIRMSATVVPVPAAIWIIGAALGGFGFAGFRSRRANA